MHVKTIEEHIYTMISKTQCSEGKIRNIMGKIENNLKSTEQKNVDKFFDGLKLEIDRNNPAEMLSKLFEKWNGFPNYRKYITGILFAGKDDAAFFAYMMNNYCYGMPEDSAYYYDECKNQTMMEIQEEINVIKNEAII
jgi:hypothetical protein